MAAAAFVHVTEPAGPRRVPAPLGIGGTGARVVVPAAAVGEQLLIDRGHDTWVARGVGEARVRINGEAASGTARELRVGDVLAVGDAQVVIASLAKDDLQITVRHLAGNETVAPLRPPPNRLDSDDEGDVDIVAGEVTTGVAAARTAARTAADAAGRPAAGRRRYLWWSVAAGVVLAIVFGLLARLQRVPLDVQPREARVSARDSVFSWQSGATLFALPGKRRLRAEFEGYEPLERELLVRDGANETQVLRLTKLPGLITVDTGGIAALVAVDGEPAGRAPGLLRVRPGPRSFTVRAERHLDAVARLEVEGGGVRQTLKVPLRTSWGKLRIESATPGARVSVGDAAPRPAPALVDLAAGAHRVRVSADGAKTWEGNVIVVAGQTSRLGPIVLGAPDAILNLRSSVAGADVTVNGIFKGRTPISLPLSAGASHDVAVSKAGYAPWSRSVDAQSGARLALNAALTPILVALTIAGEPADADVLVDGVSQGKSPRTLQLTATGHAIEVRKAGLQAYTTRVDLGAGLARAVEYRLVPEGRAADWQPPAERVTGKVAGAMRLIAPLSFQMGSERREQGRRPNETLRRVSFTRAFYIGLREVTNGEFRRFRADHRSGYVGKNSLDLDSQPVSSVTFDDAAAYCNWLSKQEGLPEAYESKNGRFQLRQPATSGYRLPTEAEWEYAARFSPQGPKRYDWGNSLPWPSGRANLSGEETGNAANEVLAGHRDEYAVAAPVGRFPANALGLFDMAGNVAEWVNDRYASYLDAGAVTDPVGPESGRANVVRGASWRTSAVSGLRLAARDSAERARDDLGFRLARYAE